MFLSSTLIDDVPEHDCLQTIEEVYTSLLDLKDVPLEDPDWELFTDGSSFMKSGKRMMSYAVTTQGKVIEAKALPADVLSQKAGLIALTSALDLERRKEGTPGYKAHIRVQTKILVKRLGWEGLEVPFHFEEAPEYILLSRPIGLDTPAYPFQPGDWVYVKWWDSDPLQAKWRGCFQVLLTTLTTVKVAGKGPWIHYSRVKKVSASETTVITETDADENMF
ncbi:hypothetical protein TURU_008639 [Turdus rufiventris]|nr:hypothetical protein TURU_008639 [Turdus rufiventris]